MEVQSYSRPARQPVPQWTRLFVPPPTRVGSPPVQQAHTPRLPYTPLTLEEILDGFGPRPAIVVVKPYTPLTLDEILDAFGPRPAKQTTQKQTALTVAPAVQVELGIDLQRRGHEVRKLLFAGFGAKIARSGYDPEDVLQEVFKGILARNNGRCPFDVKKSSFGHYVHMICDCVLKNHHRRESRRREIEQVGMPAPMSMRDDAGCGSVDAAEVAERVLVTRSHGNHPDEVDTMEEALRRLTGHLDRKHSAGLTVDALESKVAGLLAEGMNRREIANRVGVSPNKVNTIIVSLREHVRDWL